MNNSTSVTYTHSVSIVAPEVETRTYETKKIINLQKKVLKNCECKYTE